jgi:hypothetical protein
MPERHVFIALQQKHFQVLKTHRRLQFTQSDAVCIQPAKHALTACTRSGQLGTLNLIRNSLDNGDPLHPAGDAHRLSCIDGSWTLATAGRNNVKKECPWKLRETIDQSSPGNCGIDRIRRHLDVGRILKVGEGRCERARLSPCRCECRVLTS